MNTENSKQEFFEYLKNKKINIKNVDIDYLINEGLVENWKKKVEENLKSLGLLENSFY